MKRNKLLAHLFFLALTLSIVAFTPATIKANDRAFSVVVAHLKTHYGAKQRRVPFLGLANFALKMARPAGVKSFKLMVFEDLRQTNFTDGTELNASLRNALGGEWQPLARVYSRERKEQTYVYAASVGKSVKLLIVSLQQAEATLARVELNPDALAKFIENPKILGISLASNNH